jgi:ribosomal protein L7/L12
MIIKELKDLLNKLSNDFDEDEVTILVDNVKYVIHDATISKNDIMFLVEETPIIVERPKPVDTIFDEDYMSALIMTSYNKDLLLRTVKAIKDVTGLGLKESKNLMDDLRYDNKPIIIATGKTHEEYKKMKEKFPDGTTFEES